MSRPESMAAFVIEAVQARVESLAAAGAVKGHLLRGLEGVVVIELRVSPALAAQGVSERSLREVLMRELSAAGIPMPEPRNDIMLGGVVTSVDGLEAGDCGWAVCALIELKQRARLSRDPGAVFDATTWSGKVAAASAASDIERTCEQLFRQLAAELSAAFREAHSGVSGVG